MLSPSEQMRVAGSAQEGFALLDRVTPAGMRPSTQFKNLRAAYQQYLTDLGDPERQAECEGSRAKLLACCNEYLSFKFEQNKGFLHKRSALEAQRVALVESLHQRMRNDDFDKNAPAPEDPKVQKLINEAEKQLFLGGKDKNVAAAILISAKKLKESGEPLTPDSLQAKSAQYIADKAFASTVAAYPSGKVGTMIQSGTFDQKMDEIRKDQAYVADLPRLNGIWKNERLVRRARTRQICDQKIAEMTAKGTRPTEAVKKQQAKQAAKNSGAGKPPAAKKDPAQQKAQGSPAAGTGDVKGPGIG